MPTGSVFKIPRFDDKEWEQLLCWYAYTVGDMPHDGQKQLFDVQIYLHFSTAMCLSTQLMSSGCFILLCSLVPATLTSFAILCRACCYLLIRTPT